MVDLEVAFLSSAGAQPVHDPGFGVTLAWDIDLLGGYRSTMLARRPLAGKAAWLRLASRWLRRQDIVVLHGHADPDILLAAAACRVLGLPYLLRGESQAEPSAVGWRRIARHLVAGAVVRNAAGALPIGQRNAAFYRRYGRIPQYRAPYSVDNERFRDMSDAARPARAERLASLRAGPAAADGHLLREAHRAEEAARRGPRHRRTARRSSTCCCSATGRCGRRCAATRGACPSAALASSTRPSCRAGTAAATSSCLPSGREPWGLVVNEGMACGLIPVVSDAVGCGPDLVRGVGEIFPVGDVAALAAALTRVAGRPAGRRRGGP